MNAPNLAERWSVASLAPSPPATPLFGHARAFQRDPLGFLSACARDFGPVVRLRLGPLTYHLVTAPQLVQEVLQDRASNYLRDTRSSRSVRIVTGESLLNTEGQAWQRHRRLAQPIFHQGRIAAFAEVMTRAAAETAEAWGKAAEQGATLDLASEMSRLTFTAVGRCLFGAELGENAAAVEAAFPVLLNELFHRSQQVVAFPLWMPSPRHTQFKRALAVIDDVVGRIISTRRQRSDSGTDLLGLLLQAKDKDGSALSDEELRNHVVTFLLAGHETTASLVTWAFSLLAQHPHERRGVEMELDRVDFGRGPSPRLEVLPELVALQSVLHETARLYPSIWIAERRVVADDELGGFKIPAGSAVIVAPYVTQRSPDFWPEPDAFRPTRFSEGKARALLEGYFPFGAGPHRCIGQHFALMEAKIILAVLSARFRVTLVDGVLAAPLAGITLRPGSAVPVRIECR